MHCTIYGPSGYRKKGDEMARRGTPAGRLKVDEGKVKPHFGVAKLEEGKDPKFFVNLPIEYYRIESPIRAAGPALNVSEGGGTAYLPEQLKVGQYLLLKLFFSRTKVQLSEVCRNYTLLPVTRSL